MLPEVDAIIVGLGAMGSATLYQLAKRGVKVLGLEAQPEVAHSMGSSHGLTRIIRLAYFEHPAYVPLLQRSYALWRDLEAESGKDILKTTGCLDCAPPARQASVGTLQGQLTCFEGSLLAAKQHGLVHEVLTGKQANARFPGYCLPEDFQVLYQPEGGYLVPERGIEAHVAAAQQHGAQVACGTRVLGWEPAAAAGSEGAAGVVVHTEGPGGKRASYWAKKLVMTPGAWLDKLVPEMQGLLQVERQVVGWFEVEEGRAGDFTPSNFPVFLLQDRNGYYYGFPADAHGFKLGRYHHMREVVDPDNVPRDITQADEQVLRECVDNYFPGAAGKMTRASACMFTNTPDGHFILDLHPRHPQVVLASACSGHGYKFASVVGEILAQLALEGRTQHDIGFLRLDADRKGHAEFLQRCSGPSRSSL